MQPRVRYSALFILIAGVGFICSSCRTTLNSANSLQADITEAVFRHVARPGSKVAEDSHELNLTHRVYFLQVDGQDPGREFLSRMQDLNAPVKPMSSSIKRGNYRYDAATGERGAAFYVRNIHRIGPNKARAEVDFNPGGVLRASGFVYQLVKKDGKWSVI